MSYTIDVLEAHIKELEAKLAAIRDILSPINMDVSPYEIHNRIRDVLGE